MATAKNDNAADYGTELSLSLFSDLMANDYLEDAQRRFDSAKGAREKKAVAREVSTLFGVYGALVYIVYPDSAEFRQGIDSDKELSANFKRIKAWLENHDGKKRAEEFRGKLEPAMREIAILIAALETRGEL